MTATASGFTSPAFALIVAVVVVAVVVGAVDLIRQPGWAWRAAGEPKLLSLALVLLLPGVGLAIYVFGARPKVVAIASAGRAANLPFERFGDRETLATESTRSIQALALPTTLGSFGERRSARTVKTSGPAEPPPSGGGFFDDPDLVTVGGEGGMSEPVVPARTVTATATEDPTIRIPGSLGRPYRPKQRTSLDDGQSLASVASQILDASQGTAESPPAAAMVATAPAAPLAPSTGAQPGPGVAALLSEPAPAAQVPGPTFVAPAAARGFGHRSATRATVVGALATQLTAAPVATPRTPEIFRPRPDEVAPLAGSGPVAVAVATAAPRATMAARWLPDPTGRHQYRYWDGGSWTENVYDAGVESRDPAAD